MVEQEYRCETCNEMVVLTELELLEQDHIPLCAGCNDYRDGFDDGYEDLEGLLDVC